MQIKTLEVVWGLICLARMNLFCKTFCDCFLRKQVKTNREVDDFLRVQILQMKKVVYDVTFIQIKIEESSSEIGTKLGVGEVLKQRSFEIHSS